MSNTKEKRRTCARRDRPNVPVTTRLDFDKAEMIATLVEETGLPTSVVVEKLVLYALERVQLAEVTRKEMRFVEIAE